MTDSPNNSNLPSDDMSEYLQTFLDETEEQLDDLVETILALEQDATSQDDLNEAFRLIHSIKGSAGMMGFDKITVLTHHLENRFERFRSGVERLDQRTMSLVLRCIDFLRGCNDRLRDGESLGSAVDLLDELRRLEEGDQMASDASATSELSSEPPHTPVESMSTSPLELDSADDNHARDEHVAEDLVRMVVRFRADLQLADLKAQLIVARLADLGDVKSTRPDLDRLSDIDTLVEFEIRLDTHKPHEQLRAVADVDGVESVDFPDPTVELAPLPVGTAPGETPPDPNPLDDEPAPVESRDATSDTATSVGTESVGTESVGTSETLAATTATSEQRVTESVSEPPTDAVPPQPAPRQTAPLDKPAANKVAETMRIDIDRLDNLMNLAGELVVNRARFVQISSQISPAFRKATMLNRVRDFSDSLRRTIESLESGDANGSDWMSQIQHLREGFELMNEQLEIWNNGRQCISQIGEAVDQLSRISHSLQRGVLDTRMVPVSPLFNRFKRVVRDLSMEGGKKVDLQIHGEKTELDKRMIDELGDPLVHLVRNSIDHGLESPELRVSRGKPETGTISLEASHSGNNVYIRVSDDGGGIDVDRIKAKLVSKRILSQSAVDNLPKEHAYDYIWHPGFSTAQQVTDISGRGVGMDVVKTRIHQLNGTVEVESMPHTGTTFTIRLPLTLAIINCLLVRVRDITFAMPIDDVREIVSVDAGSVVHVQGKQTFDVRGEFIPLVSIDDMFRWHDVNYTQPTSALRRPAGMAHHATDVVVLDAGGKTLGMRVDELLGGQDIVIKSLSDNFINIRGLSGASILGNGQVCLMLDVNTVIEMAIRSARTADAEGATP